MAELTKKYFKCFDPWSGNPSKTVAVSFPVTTRRKLVTKDFNGVETTHFDEEKQVTAIVPQINFPEAEEITEAEYATIDTATDSPEMLRARLRIEKVVESKLNAPQKAVELAAKKAAAALKIKEAKDKKPK